MFVHACLRKILKKMGIPFQYNEKGGKLFFSDVIILTLDHFGQIENNSCNASGFLHKAFRFQ